MTKNADLLDKFEVDPPLYAGFWKRVLAYILDSIPLAIIDYALEGFIKNENTALLVFTVLCCVYTVGFHASKYQATPGKMLMAIKVVGYDGRRISYVRAFWRFWAESLSVLTLGIGFVMAAFTDRKQALHDILCSTYVINKETL